MIANPGLITAAPSCFVNGDGNDFNGQPAATPASWCVCDDHGTPRIYPTIDTPSSLCGYSALPTATIAPLVTAAKGETVTSCRIESLIATDTTVGPYCTCNDNFMHKIDTWTDNGSTVTGCIATRTAAAPTSTVDKPTMTTNSQTTVNTPPPMLICNSAGDCTDYDCPDGSKPFCTLTGGDPFTHNCVC